MRRLLSNTQGEGSSEEIKPKIFTPLFTIKSKGQGFGLAVCRRIIEAQGGTITFESQQGKGTKFIVNLPKHKTKISPSESYKQVLNSYG